MSSAANRSSTVLLAAFCSGCATLVYELVWMRVLTLSVGATFPAITVVLAGIMAGLGLGAALGGRIADRTDRPLRAYAIVEVLVALTAATFPFVALAVTAFELPAIGPLSGRALLAGLTMMPATTLIGTTFPLLSAALHRGDGGSHVPRLYFVNTVGAALGCVLGGLVLPFEIGVVGTLVLAAALNLGAAALAATTKLEARPPAPPEPAAPVEIPTLLLGLAFGSGLLLTLAQLYWTRSILQFDRHQLPFPDVGEIMATVLATLLFGNALGGLLAERLRGGLREVAAPLAWIWIAGALLFVAAFEWFGVRLYGLGRLIEHTPLVLPVRLAPVLVASAVLGATFPLLARLYAGALAGHGDRMGRIWAWNTAGAVIGSVAGGWVLLPAIGTDRGLALCALLSLGLAAGVTRVGGGRNESIGVGAAGLAVLAALIVVPLGAGQLWLYRFGPEAILASWEGWEATTVVVRPPDGSEAQLYSNGRGMTGVSRYLTGGRLMGESMKGKQDVLVVGFGTGGLAKGLLETLQPKSLTIVEIDGAQLQAAKWFETDSVLADERVHMVVDDALHFLDSTDRTFDLILIDGWGPEASQALYSADFHQRAMARLAPGGFTWAKLGPVSDSSRKPLQDAFRCVYPHAWFDPGEGFLMGAAEDLRDAPAPKAAPADDACDPLTQLRPRHIRPGTGEPPKPPADGQPPVAERPRPGGKHDAPAQPVPDGPDPNKLTPEQLRQREGRP
jgi:spermidine synthase